ncbi:peptidoglycan-binding protein [Streptomyces sp. NPDC059783]|uniref:peptidoglycan-binding protein n=1 Tax=Streptomyces sp. NPDC059783 TaxID=3346944 RepID=UPI00364C8591
MTTFHVAVDHIDPNTLALTTTYYGTVDQAHVDEVRAIAALDTSERWVKEHPRLDGAFMVLRDDGDLDVYVPTDAAEYRVYEPDPAPKGVKEGSADWTCREEECSWSFSAPIVDGAIRAEGYNDAFAVHMAEAHGQQVAIPRGASGPAYIDGAIRFGDQSIGGAMDTPGNPPRVVQHTTESPSGKSYFYSVAAYLIRVGAEPQVIYDPVSDLLGQFGPLTQSGRALRNDGTRRTNREGKVCIQMEVLGHADSPWTKGFNKSKKPNYRKFEAAARAHGVPDDWPAGKPPATAGAAAAGSRSRTTWQTKGGYYAHAQVPGNDHWDPGAIDTSIVPGKAGSSNDPTPTPATPSKPATKDAFPGAAKFGPGANNAYVTRLGQMLVKRGGKRFYKEGPGPRWGDADKNATRAFQRAQGWTGSDADGIPGPTTWAYLVDGKGKSIPSAAPSQPALEPFPGASFFHGGRHSPIITAMGRRLVAEGCGTYKTGPGPNWTNADKASYAAWQRKLGYTGTAADGIPGKASWDKLRIPKS